MQTVKSMAVSTDLVGVCLQETQHGEGILHHMMSSWSQGSSEALLTLWLYPLPSLERVSAKHLPTEVSYGSVSAVPFCYTTSCRIVYKLRLQTSLDRWQLSVKSNIGKCLYVSSVLGNILLHNKWPYRARFIILFNPWRCRQIYSGVFSTALIDCTASSKQKTHFSTFGSTSKGLPAGKHKTPPAQGMLQGSRKYLWKHDRYTNSSLKW